MEKDQTLPETIPPEGYLPDGRPIKYRKDGQPKQSQLLPHLLPKGIKPKGRPKGSKNYSNLKAQDLLDRNADKVLMKVIEKALEGNETCLKMCMDRILPSKRAIDITKTETKDQEINIFVEQSAPQLEEKQNNIIDNNRNVIDITPIVKKEVK